MGVFSWQNWTLRWVAHEEVTWEVMVTWKLNWRWPRDWPDSDLETDLTMKQTWPGSWAELSWAELSCFVSVQKSWSQNNGAQYLPSYLWSPAQLILWISKCMQNYSTFLLNYVRNATLKWKNSPQNAWRCFHRHLIDLFMKVISMNLHSSVRSVRYL